MCHERVELVGAGHAEVVDEPVVEGSVDQVDGHVEVGFGRELAVALGAAQTFPELVDAWPDESFSQVVCQLLVMEGFGDEPYSG